ncbi:MAG TPA: substrate-binding domain-containing protein [Pseudonocardia sp.]
MIRPDSPASSRPLRIRRLLAAAALAVAVPAATAGCGDRLSTTHVPNLAHPTIGYSVYDMTSFITLGQQGVETEAAALGAKVLWRSANNDVNQQASQIQSLVNQKVDAIVLAAVDAATLAPQIKQAKQRGIPVFGVNTALTEPGAGELDGYVGPDDVGAGSAETKLLAEALGGHGNVVVMQGPLANSAEIDRTTGIQRELARQPGLKVLSTQPADWDRTKAYTLMQNWLSAYGAQVNGVIAENDDMAIGASRALAAVNRTDVKVVGIDGIQDGMSAVRSGQLHASLLQNAPLELGIGLAAAVKSLRGQPVPKKALCQMPPLTRTTVNRYYDQLYGNPKEFLTQLPTLIERNLAPGNYANQ